MRLQLGKQYISVAGVLFLCSARDGVDFECRQLAPESFNAGMYRSTVNATWRFQSNGRWVGGPDDCPYHLVREAHSKPANIRFSRKLVDSLDVR